MNIRRACRGLGVAFLLLGLQGCSSPAQAPQTTSAPKAASVQQFASTCPLPQHYERVEGTALFSCSHELAAYLADPVATLPDSAAKPTAFFLLLNPSKPTEGILVKAANSIPDSVVQNSVSRKIQVSGKVGWVESPEAAKYCLDTLGITLAGDGPGHLAYIANELEIDYAAKPSPLPPGYSRISLPPNLTHSKLETSTPQAPNQANGSIASQAAGSAKQ